MHVIQLHHLLIWVTVSAVVQWLFGAFWYGVMFRKSWRGLVGYAEGEKMKNAPFGLVVSFIACWLVSFTLGHVIGWAGTSTLTGGAALGVVCWVGLIAPPIMVQHIYENRRVNLFAMNVCYWLCVMAIGGAILGAFHS
jgi:hypothetical protein